ncbi:MAG: tRNA (adenosine(37)-N6)-threonylcarbamoyltransferase complex dimerization subunit type 1 TsaB [Chloroflexota bacterium]
MAGAGRWVDAQRLHHRGAGVSKRRGPPAYLPGRGAPLSRDSAQVCREVLIALDTADEYLGLAAYADGQLLAEETRLVGQNHSAELLPSLAGLLARLRADLKAVRAVGVSLGPGSFNGIRVGVSTAKALAYGLDVPVIGVPTLEVQAWQFAAFGLPVACLQPAGREVVFGVFEFKGGETVRLVAERVGSLAELAKVLPERAVVCGTLPPGRVEELRRYARGGWVSVFGPVVRRRPGVLAELAWGRLVAGRTDDPLTLEPLYVRPPHITPPRRSPFSSDAA